MAELSRYQRQVVKNYYENLDTALVQRLGEQVTDLYLAEGKKRTKIWGSVAKSLEKLEVAQSKILPSFLESKLKMLSSDSFFKRLILYIYTPKSCGDSNPSPSTASYTFFTDSSQFIGNFLRLLTIAYTINLLYISAIASSKRLKE